MEIFMNGLQRVHSIIQDAPGLTSEEIVSLVGAEPKKTKSALANLVYQKRIKRIQKEGKFVYESGAPLEIRALTKTEVFILIQDQKFSIKEAKEIYKSLADLFC